MIRRLVWLIPIALSAAQVNPKTYLADVTYLASPELKGRGTGTPELEKAAAFIAGQFKFFGLKPVNGKTFELEFPVTIGAHLGPGNSFKYTDAGVPTSLEAARDFTPFNFSSSGKFAGGIVFAGYGITANELHYDDYAGLDVKDKFVLILRHEPQESDAKSIFAGKALTGHATFASKATNAKAHGARGVIVINDIYAHGGGSTPGGSTSGEDKLESFGRTAGPHDAGVFFIQMKVSTAERWLAAEGHNLRQTVQEIDQDLKPRSFELSKVRAEVDVDVRQETKTVHNVAAYLPGTTDEYLIIGAHYDHLGLGGENSLAPSQTGTVHPGADDNASGTAGVIELARWFSKQPKQKRGILFLTFAGEELGLLGSAWYVNHPTLPLDNAVAMINMDMIGRVRDGRIFVSGAGTGSTFDQLIADLKPEAPIHIDLSDKSGYGASDHSSFTAKQVPVLFFFSGLHADYHKPSDTADKIDAEDAAKVLDYVGDLAGRLLADASRPQYQRVAEPFQAPGGSPSGAAGYGPNFGSIPDFNEPPKGVRFSDVRDGTPAAKAGLRAGDILIEFDGKEIGNLYDFTYALRSHQAGDEVLVKVIRGSQIIEAKVLLTERR